MNESIRRLSRIEAVAASVFLLFMVFALALIYWAAVRAPQLAERSDNPRAVEAERQIRRGRIVDANGIVVAETVGADEEPVRHYPITPAGPAVGYYSFRHGTAGVEATFDDVLRGANDDTWQSFWRRTLHHTQIGHDVRLTLDADWQRAAEELMKDQTGSLLVLSVPDGAVRVMVSAPSYDANRIDELFDTLVSDDRAPLLNRATQGVYQPGLALQPFVLAYSVDRERIGIAESVPTPSEPVAINGQVITCQGTLGGEATWVQVLQQACPAPMVRLAQDIGADGVIESLEAFALFSQPELSLATATEPPRTIQELDAAILGQDLLTVSPLQVARALVALASDGLLPTPYVVSQVQDSAGVWQTVEASDASTDDSARILSSDAAQAVVNALTTPDDVIAEYEAAALSGPGEETTSWYLGLTPRTAPEHVVVVVLEGRTDVTAAEDIGRAILRAQPAS